MGKTKAVPAVANRSRDLRLVEEMDGPRKPDGIIMDPVFSVLGE